MIFVITGSRLFQFDRLLKELDRLVREGIITDKVFAQTGDSVYKPVNYEFKDFLNGDEFNASIKQADIVITHAGTGSVIKALKAGKKVIAVARLKQYQEAIDDHQLELVRSLSASELIIGAEDVSQLEKIFSELDTFKTKPFVSNTEHIMNIIDGFIERIQHD